MKKILYKHTYCFLLFLSNKFNSRRINKYKVIVGSALVLISSGCQSTKKVKPETDPQNVSDTVTSDNGDNYITCYVQVPDLEDTLEVINPPDNIPEQPININIEVMCYDVMIEEPEPEPVVSCYIIVEPEPFNPEDGELVSIAEKMPEFKNGNVLDYLKKHLKYPEEDICVEGRVILQFIIEKDGSLSNIEVVRSLHPSFDSAAVKVVREMPLWQPGTQNGEPVRVKYTLPVSFRPEK